MDDATTANDALTNSLLTDLDEMAIHSHSSYAWTNVDGIDGDSKGSILDANTSIDPSFSQSGHSGSEDSSFTGDVAQAVAKAAVATRNNKVISGGGPSVNDQAAVVAAAARANAAAMAAAGRQSSPPDHNDVVGSLISQAHSQQQHQQHQQQQHQQQQHSQLSQDEEMEINRQGRPLTNTKRAQQNRQAQRAFRQRKELYIKDLEAKVKELEQSKDTIDALRQENIQLRDYILALQSRLIEHPGGVPTPPAVYARQANDMYEHHKTEK